MEKKKCMQCQKFINLDKDKFVQVSTINIPDKKDDHVFFHFSCWALYFQKCVEKKARANVQFMQEQAVKLFDSSELKPLLKGIKGVDIALNMLKIPINSDRLISKEKIVEKINHDRKRAGKTKAKFKKKKM